MVSALGAIWRQIEDFKARNLSLVSLSQELMQNTLSTSHITTGKKLGRLFATNSIVMLGICFKVGQIFASWLTREVQELYLDRDTLTLNWHGRKEQSQQHAVQSQDHGHFGLLLSLALSSWT